MNLRYLSSKEEKKRRLVGNRPAIVSFVCSIMLPLITIALVVCQLAFFPLFSAERDMAFHLLLYFTPFVGVAMYLRFSYYLAWSVVLGGVLCAHAHILSLDYYELRFQNPLVAILFTVTGALLIWVAMHAAGRFRDARGWDKGSWIGRNAPFVVAMLLFSPMVSMLPLLADMVKDGVHLGVFASGQQDFLASIQEPAFKLQVGADTIAWFASFALARLLANRVLRESTKKTIRELFGHWLTVTVVSAFLITLTVSYCLSTLQSLNEAKRSLDGQIGYLQTQVQSHVESQEALRLYESDLVLNKAESVASVLTHDSSALENQSDLMGLCSVLGLTSLTVCDQNGLVIADADGEGVGTFSFADNAQTKQYLGLVDGTQENIVEAPRDSIGADGKSNGERRVFVGVPRQDQAGFIQASVDTQDVERVVEVASLET